MDSRIEEILKEKLGDEHEEVPLMSRIEILLDRLESGGGGGSGSDSYTKEEINDMMRDIFTDKPANFFISSFYEFMPGEVFTDFDGFFIRTTSKGYIEFSSNSLAKSNNEIFIGFLYYDTYPDFNKPLFARVAPMSISEITGVYCKIYCYDEEYNETIVYDYGDGVELPKNTVMCDVYLVIEEGATSSEYGYSYRPIIYINYNQNEYSYSPSLANIDFDIFAFNTLSNEATCTLIKQIVAAQLKGAKHIRVALDAQGNNRISYYRYGTFVDYDKVLQKNNNEYVYECFQHGVYIRELDTNVISNYSGDRKFFYNVYLKMTNSYDNDYNKQMYSGIVTDSDFNSFMLFLKWNIDTKEAELHIKDL